MRARDHIFFCNKAGVHFSGREQHEAGTEPGVGAGLDDGDDNKKLPDECAHVDSEGEKSEQMGDVLMEGCVESTYGGGDKSARRMEMLAEIKLCMKLYVNNRDIGRD
ncbi:hypothetical protein E2C01_069552 [Portunus trituberculatus]|uniref:Uncharacterized protein n=1 Tax=Portunus trituberculatus TaxID=210409 RepID=A0A5B7I2N1_PORTR|nr:hypothetical protein [Portunus trituberculatus]